MKTKTLFMPFGLAFALAALLPVLTAALLFAGAGCGSSDSSSSNSTPTPSPTPTPTPNPVLTGHITFTSNRDTGGVVSQIYAMDVAAGSISRLTTTSSDDTSYGWSPDGTQILFVSNRDNNGGEKNNRDVYLMNADGTNIRRVTNDTSKNSLDASWSPDGTTIVFSQATQIAVVSAATGSTSTPLEGGTLSDSYSPGYSPDGTKIVFVADTPGANNTGIQHAESIFVMNADGSASSRVQITNSDEYIRHVVWSPDGQWLVFDSTQDTGGATSQRTQLYRMAPDGSQRTRLTNNGAQDISPSWSPDGKLILFSSNRDHGGGSGGTNLYDLYAMNPDTGAVTRITTNGPNAFVTAHGWKQP